MLKNKCLRAAHRFFTVLLFSMREEWQRRWNLLARLGFFSVILFIWSTIWRVAEGKLQEGGPNPLTAGNITWYIGVTELVVISIAMAHLPIEEDIRSGGFLAARSRPMGYLAIQLARNFGTSIAQFVLLAVVGSGILFVYTGEFPWAGLPIVERLAFMLATIGLAFMGLAIACTWYVLMGISGVWFEEVSPMIWIFQKLMFLFGGLVVPLALYPGHLREISEWSPFGPMLGETAALVITPSWSIVALTLEKLVVWLGLSLALATVVTKRAQRTADFVG